MADLTVNGIDKTGIDLSAVAVAADVAGDSVNYSSGLFVTVFNGDAAPKVVTVTPPVSSVVCSGFGALDVDPLVYNIAAGEQVSFSVGSGYADGGVLSWTYDAVTNVTVGVYS